ncbi:MAG: hypothetical protein Q7J07_00765 [Pelolinea sp.]|nr:hypothetical protein [Pelolinea sp.]
MKIRLPYGTQQQFRYHTRDINIIGRVEEVTYPMMKSYFRLNSRSEVYFRVENISDPGIDWTYQYKDSPAVNRLKDIGDFNIELPIDFLGLKAGENKLTLFFEDSAEQYLEVEIIFTWDPSPIELPIDLRDLTGYACIQEIGQVVNGAFDLDPIMNLIRSRAPVYPDALCVLGSPHGSQEATYNVRFTDLTKVKWLGPSDYFVGMEGPASLGIKPGWSSFGMMNIDPRWCARAFLAFGDHSDSHNEWVVQTAPPKRFIAKADVLYCVRHQVLYKDGVNTVRFKIWKEKIPEPNEWLVEEDDTSIPSTKPKFKTGSFSIFQHSGMPIEWSNIFIVGLE